MKRFAWDAAKNRRLLEERKISFEEIVAQIGADGLLDILDHPNRARYPGQRIFVVRAGAYAYLVPFVEDKEEIVLKTIIPSRKATRKYLRGEENA